MEIKDNLILNVKGFLNFVSVFVFSPKQRATTVFSGSECQDFTHLFQKLLWMLCAWGGKVLKVVGGERVNQASNKIKGQEESLRILDRG